MNASPEFCKKLESGDDARRTWIIETPCAMATKSIRPLRQEKWEVVLATGADKDPGGRSAQLGGSSGATFSCLPRCNMMSHDATENRNGVDPGVCLRSLNSLGMRAMQGFTGIPVHWHYGRFALE